MMGLSGLLTTYPQSRGLSAKYCIVQMGEDKGIWTNDHADTQNKTKSCVMWIHLLQNILLCTLKIVCMFFKYNIHLYVL